MRPLLAALLAAGLAGSLCQAADVAVIVNPDNPEVNLTPSELEKMLRRDQQYWRGGGKIYLVLLGAGSPEKDTVLKRVYHMDDAELKQFWLGKLFRGEISRFPRIVHSGEEMKRIVAQARNALGFIDAAATDATVKVLAIDGKRPGEAGYPLSAADH